MNRILSFLFLLVMLSAIVPLIIAQEVIRLQEIRSDIEEIQVIVESRGGVSSTYELLRYEELRMELRQIQTQRLKEILGEMENIQACVKSRGGVSSTYELLKFEELRRELKKILPDWKAMVHTPLLVAE